MNDIQQTFTLPGSPTFVAGFDPSHDNIPNTVDAAVATGGTITFNYPANLGPVNYSGGNGVATMFVRQMQALFTQAGDFDIAYGKTNITVTYRGVTTIPAGSNINLQAPRVDTTGQPHVAGYVLPATVVNNLNVGI